MKIKHSGKLHNNLVLKLMVDDIMRKMIKEDSIVRKAIKQGLVFKLLSKKERKKFEDEILNLEPYGA